MRTILFSGKRKDNGEEIYGDLLQNIDCVKIREQEKNIKGVARSFEVDPDTVSEFTGLYDSTKWADLTEEEKEAWMKHGYTAEEWKGIPIFENDIVKLWNEREPDDAWIAVVEFGNPNGRYDWGFQLHPITSTGYNTDILLWVDMEEFGAYCRVIGSTTENRGCAQLQMQ